ncbi:MAG: fibronectin, partial [candidate division KSB1 bacterium]|nr:fibronectin [candidate division KSB1 bacterium]
NEFMPVEFKLIGRFPKSIVTVDGVPAGKLDFLDFVDEIDENLPADRMLYNVVNTAIGITMTRKIYAFSQQNHDNYFIYDYVFKNTGIIDKKGTVYQQTLEGVVFYFQYRYAPSREGGPYGYYFLPQSSSWGHNTMNDTMHVIYPETGEEFLALYSWHGRHSKAAFDNIGGPWGGEGGDGRLSAAQHPGVMTLHADKSATDKSHDPNQPTTTMYLDSDNPITSGNDQFNAQKMAQEYAAMTAGHPELTHAEAVGDGFADLFGGTPGGFSHTQGFGPYTLAPGDSIHIVLVEALAGLSRDSCFSIGARWLKGTGPFVLPDGSTTNDKDEYKNAWVFTGRDSLAQTFKRAIANWKSGFTVPMPPPPPEKFTVTSGGDRIILEWSDNAESWPTFRGYRIYRAIHVPDSTYELIFECGPGTDHPEIVNRYEDTTPQRGFDYYYYIVSYDDGSTNDIHPGVPLESSRFYTMTNEPAYLRRAAGKSLEEIRVVPNPYNIRARDLQFGQSGPDRIMFLNLPPVCTIKIFTERGDLIYTIEHTDGSGDEAWNSVTKYGQVIVSGVYIVVFETPDGEKTFRKFVVIR